MRKRYNKNPFFKKMTLPMHEFQFDHLINSLRDKGYWVGDHLFAQDALVSMSRYADRLAESQFKAAGIGRAESFQLEPSQRSDRIHWLTGDAPEESWFLNAMDALRLSLNRQLFLGLAEYECHFARYAPGAFYRKHRDTFRAQAGQAVSCRMISTVLYLNSDWGSAEGGELVIYDDQERMLEKVSPIFGRFVVFLSEEFPHEVLPAIKERKSIAGWMRVPSV